ncbi:MAG: DNA primase catalytic subunit PriS [Candidatus Micrarchaeia archaeon]
MNEEAFVRKKFAAWYAANPPSPPEEVGRREFGVGSWSKKIETRHMAFAGERELAAFLAREAPFFVSYSAARYAFPDARPMQKKGWIGSDLMFDLDADALALNCAHGRGWVCDACLNAVKEEAARLIEEFLVPDFGLAKDEIQLNFSGNRGYHIHIQRADVLGLENAARREIVDYLMANGLDLQKIFFVDELRVLRGPMPNDGGWGGKLARAFLRALKEKRLGELGIHPRTANRFYAREEKVAAGIERGNWDVINIQERKAFWAAVAAKLSVRLADKIDQNVTADSTKLIRLPDSLHGETGLLAKRLKNLDAFDPLKHAVAFDGKNTVRVKVARAPAFRFGEQSFGPFENQEAELPEGAAIYLLCKKAAVLA